MRRLTPEERRREAQGWRESIVQAFHTGRRRGLRGSGNSPGGDRPSAARRCCRRLRAGLVAYTLPDHALELLDRILRILMIVELLYTAQVSFREHALVPEPFLIVGLIAAVRRLLVLTAEFAQLLEKNEGTFQGAMLELGLLTVMIVALVVSLVALKRHYP